MSQLKLSLGRDPRITPVKTPTGQSALPKEKKKTVSPSVAVMNLVGGANKTPPADSSPSIPKTKPAKLVQTHLFSEKPRPKAVPVMLKVKPDSKEHSPLSSTSSPALTTTSPRKPLPGQKQKLDNEESAPLLLSSSVRTTTSPQKPVPGQKSERSIPSSSISLSVPTTAAIIASQKLAPGQKQKLDTEGYLLLSFTSGAATLTSASQKQAPAGKKHSGVIIKKSPPLPQTKSIPPPLIKLSPSQAKVALSTSPTKPSSAKPLIFTPPVLTNPAATLTLSKATSLPGSDHAVTHSSPPLPKIPKTSPPHQDPLLPPKAKRPKTSFTSIPISRVRTIMRTNVNRCPQNPVGQESIMVIAKATERFISKLTKEARTSEENSEVGYGELAQFVQASDKFKFLRDILPKKVLARDYIPQSTD